MDEALDELRDFAEGRKKSACITCNSEHREFIDRAIFKEWEASVIAEFLVVRKGLAVEGRTQEQSVDLWAKRIRAHRAGCKRATQ